MFSFWLNKPEVSNVYIDVKAPLRIDNAVKYCVVCNMAKPRPMAEFTGRNIAQTFVLAERHIGRSLLKYVTFVLAGADIICPKRPVISVCHTALYTKTYKQP